MLIRLEFRNKFIAAGDSLAGDRGTRPDGKQMEAEVGGGVSQVRIFYVDFIAIFLLQAETLLKLIFSGILKCQP